MDKVLVFTSHTTAALSCAGDFGGDVGKCGADFDIFDGGPDTDTAFDCEVLANVP